MSSWYMIALLLVVIGAINWGLVGLFNWNLVHAIFGFSMTVENVVYILVGLSGLWVAYATWFSGGKKSKK